MPDLHYPQKAALEEHNLDSLTQSLIAARLELAQISASNEDLQKSYRDLERRVCTLKLENAGLKDRVEDLEEGLMLAQRNQGWGGVLSDTIASLEAVGVPASIVLPAGSPPGPVANNPHDFISLDMSVAGSTR